MNPVVDAYCREHPDEVRFIGPSASLDDLLTELGFIRELLTSGAEVSDIQLFSCPAVQLFSCSASSRTSTRSRSRSPRSPATPPPA